jgi:hypothetical protein
MAVNKNFVVKNGLEVNNDLLLADSANQKVGIGTSVPNYTLHVLGGIGATEAYISGVTTLAATGGITTTGGDLYVGGDLFVKDDIVYDEVTGRNLNITGVATIGTLYASGVSTSFVSAVGIQSAGLAIGAGITQLNFIGAGNTFEAVGNTVNISIAGGGGGGGGGGAVSIGATAPTDASNGDLWYSINLARTFVWYDEEELGVGSSAFWVDAAPFNLTNKYVSRYGDTMVAGLGFTAGTVSNPTGYFVGDSDTGFYSPGADKFAIAAGGSQIIQADASTLGVSTNTNITGILTATNILADSISIGGQQPLTALAAVGLGTPIDPSSTEGLDVVYYTDRTVALGGTIIVPDSADIAYTPYGDVVVNAGEEFTVSEGDQFMADVLGIGSIGTGQNSPGGTIRADQFTARMAHAPRFPFGLHANTGIVTSTAGFDGDIVGSGATFTSINLPAGSVIAGSATSAIYTQEWILGADGTNNYTFSGNGFIGAENDPTIRLVRGQKYRFTNNMGAHPFRIQSTANGSTGTAYNDGITNNDVSNGTLIWDVQFDTPNVLYYQCTAHAGMGGIIYIVDAGVGISSAGGSIATNATNLNFVGAGNTFFYNSATNTVDVSIAGGGGGGSSDAKVTYFASGYGGRTVRTK